MKLPALAWRTGHWTFTTVVGALLIGVETVWLAGIIVRDPIWDLGMDYRYYMSLGHQWLADGTFYLPHQLGGPYEAQLLGLDPTTSTLYPPSALLLFVPFTVLPAVLWWVIPIALAGYCLVRLRPAPWAWVVMLALLAWPRAIGAYLFGNTDMWIMAAVAAGLVWGWPAILVTIKPTLAPLALIGIRSRWSWLFGMMAVLLTLPLWDDYAAAMTNLRGLDIGYSLGALPLVCLPIVAWLGRQRDDTHGIWLPRRAADVVARQFRRERDTYTHP